MSLLFPVAWLTPLWVRVLERISVPRLEIPQWEGLAPRRGAFPFWRSWLREEQVQISWEFDRQVSSLLSCKCFHFPSYSTQSPPTMVIKWPRGCWELRQPFRKAEQAFLRRGSQGSSGSPFGGAWRAVPLNKMSAYLTLFGSPCFQSWVFISLGIGLGTSFQRSNLATCIRSLKATLTSMTQRSHF